MITLVHAGKHGQIPIILETHHDIHHRFVGVHTRMRALRVVGEDNVLEVDLDTKLATAKNVFETEKE